MQAQDEIFMQRCLDLARLGHYYVAPNPMVGAVLVSAQGTILAEGWHRQYGGPHAEVNCIRQAEQYPTPFSWHDTTLYVNLEPCSHWGKTPPCANLIVEKGIGQVVVGSLDPNPQVSGRGIQILRDAGIGVRVGVLETACRELNKRFLCLQEKRRPYVILKWAQTADGYIDRVRVDGKPECISTPLTKQLVHQQRAENMAIMVGTRTALLDNPRLTTTHWCGRNPIRVVVDRHNVLPPDLRLFSPEAETIVYRDSTDWQFILEDLGKRGIHSVLVEGGATLLNTIIQSGLWDEAHVEVSDQPLSAQPGVKAPVLPLPDDYHMVEQHRFYEIRQKNLHI